MFRNLVLLGLVGCLAVACAPADRVSLPATMAVSPEFSPEETEAIFAAADAWSKATGGVADLQVGIGDSGTIRVVSFDGVRAGATAQTYVDGDGAELRLDTAYVSKMRRAYHASDAEALRDTVMHELGHAFGLTHVPGGLMDASAYGHCTVDADTLSRFCANYRCN